MTAVAPRTRRLGAAEAAAIIERVGTSGWTPAAVTALLAQLDRGTRRRVWRAVLRESADPDLRAAALTAVMDPNGQS